MELSCAFPPGPDVARHVQLAEELGYRRAWIYDSPALYGDVWMQLTECALATTRIGLGPGVLVPSLRHPMTTAAAIASLERLAPGRVAVAIGTGFTGRFVMGRQPLTWATTERLTAQIVGLLRGDTVEIDGAPARMIHPPGWTTDRPIDTPILMGANGPKGLEAAARLGADGVVSIFGAQAGWDWSALFGYGTVLEDGESADSPRVLDAAGPGGAVVYHGMYEADPSLLDGFEGGPEWRAAVEEFPEGERHLHTHELHFVGMTERDRASVTGDLIAGTTWTAPAEELRSRLAQVADQGVTEFWYAPMGSDIPRELQAFRALVD
ncbi:MAG TPA: LLM class flavin-dependent oxidoreductase [Microthrixaceae bacterium]|nr:LLM class flavin-dependent oxidoreductase [Microthrixaceae bacterium]